MREECFFGLLGLMESNTKSRFELWDLIKYSQSTNLASRKSLQKFILSLNQDLLKRLIQKYIKSLLPDKLSPITNKELSKEFYIKTTIKLHSELLATSFSFLSYIVVCG